MKHLQARLSYLQIWKKDAKLPTTFEECKPWFISLAGRLSPENLHCDGEASAADVKRSMRAIRGEWKELEKIAGCKVSESDAEQMMIDDVIAERNRRNA